MNGTVRKVKVVEGFGFIRGDDDLDRFFHRSELKDIDLEHLREGTPVSFDHEEGKVVDGKQKGPRANNIRVLNEAAATAT